MSVNIIDDFYDPETLNEISSYLNGILYSKQDEVHLFSCNMVLWDDGLYRHQNGSDLEAPPLVLIHYPQAHGERGKIIHDLIKEKTNERVKEFGLRCQDVTGPMFHIWSPQSYINWHNDFRPGVESEQRHGAATIYLNREWALDKGGEFLYNDDAADLNNVKRVTPAENRAVVLDGWARHKTTPVAPENIRKSLQIWLTKI